MLALGLQEPVKRTLQTRAQIPYTGALEALDEDANALAGSFSVELAASSGSR